MERLIPVASKLQDVLGALGQSTSLDLPQIVVIGGQSSGKSSVLEGIVGRTFLPRGNGIVTRRPLILQLYNTSSPNHDDEERESTTITTTSSIKKEESREEKKDSTNSSEKEGEEWGEFLHLPGKRFYSYPAIRTEISTETKRLTGPTSQTPHPTPIHLKLYSPHLLNLTLVDLPGISKVAVGDQPPDIEDRIRSMCLQYISNPNSIILAVTSATEDLANSDALKLAREVDDDGRRTVGVLTKLDLMDGGTDAMEVLMNRVVPLRLGYVGVVNRGQRDVEADVSVEDGWKREMDFLKCHAVYGRDAVLENRLGVKCLARLLNRLLMDCIRDCLPALKGRIGSMLADVEVELDVLGEEVESAEGERSLSTMGGRLLSLVSSFAEGFGDAIDGRGRRISNYLPAKNSSPANSSEPAELHGGARISYIFNDIFSSSLLLIQPFDNLTDDEIRTTIRNSNGTRPSLFVPEISFDILVRRQIARLEQPGLHCVDLVYEELTRIGNQVQPQELTRFPNLTERLMDVVKGVLKNAVGPTQDMVANLIQIELAYINTSHPDFIGGSRAVAKLMDKVNSQQHQQPDNGNAARPTSSSASSSSLVEEGNSSSSLAVPTSSGPAAPPSSGKQPGTDLSPSDAPFNTQLPAGTSSTTTGPGAGGIMSFIFRGATPPQTNLNNNNNNSSPPTTTTGRGGGPPTIVQLPQVPTPMLQTSTPPTSREKVETEIIKTLIESYFTIVRKNFIDMVPKTIMHFLVNNVRNVMQNELVKELYRDDAVEFLMKEAEDVKERRRVCLEMKDLLGRALEIVGEVRDFDAGK